ncbi:MAG: NAD(P)/FAD-dependent oxidoreductase [Methanoregula sp.]|nr:NAD(P)/FAD-dependent oxidoreductase [Methanoregula sp.]
MNIAIAGAGITGGYLAKLLEQRGISPDVYDGMDHDTRCRCRSCGWGVPRGLETYLADVGLDFNEYLFEPMSSMNFDGLVAKTPLCTLDKPRLIRDFTQGLRLNRQNLGLEKADEYDIVVDATGITRAFLPPCRSDLTLPTLQHRVVVESYGSERLEAGVYGNRIPGLGYLWIFPLGNNHYHIGIGGIGLVRLDSLLDRFYQDSSNRFSFTMLCSCDGFVRVASPYYSTPFYCKKTRKDGTHLVIVGVGESIGTVAPFTGEGIVHSLECARIFADSWPDFEHYTKSVLARFAWMKKERETLNYLLSYEGKHGPRVRDRWRFFCNARRSGIGLPIIEAFKRMGALSQWVESPGQTL